MPRNNKDKTTEVDESILDETPPNINEPQTETPEPEEETVVEETEEEQVEEDKIEAEPETTTEEVPTETVEQKEQRYKQQQTEAQIQAAKNRSLIEKVDEATKVGEPTIEELKAFVKVDGVDWDELTTFEQSMARKSYLAEKRFDLVNEAVQSTKKIDEWATKVDTYIDETDGKPEFIKLSGHEADFRKYCMSEAHRGTPIEILLGAFLYNLPQPEKKRGSLFETGSGGEKTEKPGKITDADTVQNLRQTNPREYRRQVRAGKIDLDI